MAGCCYAICGVAQGEPSRYARDVPRSHYPTMRDKLARNVRRRRQELGLSQEAAAHDMQMATRHFQKLEAGELNVTLRTLCKVAETLRTTVDSLLR